jgi:hypothetical protein
LLSFLSCGFYTLFLNNKNIFKKNIINVRPASTATIVPTYNQSIINLSNKNINNNNNNNKNDDILPSYESITLFHIT